MMLMVVKRLSKNGSMKLTMERHTIAGLTGAQYSLYLHMSPLKNFVRLETLYLVSVPHYRDTPSDTVCQFVS